MSDPDLVIVTTVPDIAVTSDGSNLTDVVVVADGTGINDSAAFAATASVAAATATTQAGNAAASASTATGQASIAVTQAANAAASATTATTQASNAAASAAVAAGAAGFSYTWSTNTASSDPGAGGIKGNNATLSAITALYLSETDANANALAALIADWGASASVNKAVVKLAKTASPGTVWAEFYVVAAVTDNGAWDTLTVTYKAGTGVFANADALTINAYLVGDKGSAGVATTGSALAPMINGKIVATAASNARTYAVKTLAGADPSVGDPVRFIFESVTRALGPYVIADVVGALSITIPSTATVGHASARDQQIIVSGINSGSDAVPVVELAVSCKLFDLSTRLISSTTISAAATDPATMYSATGRTNVPWEPLARVVENQTTAGTWTSGPVQMDLAPFTLPTNICRIYLAVDQTGVTSATFTKVNMDTVDFDPDSIADVATNRRIQPKVPGTYSVYGSLSHAGSLSGLGLTCIAKNGTRVQSPGLSVAAGATDNRPSPTTVVQMNGTSDYLELQGLTSVSSGTATFQGNIAITNLMCIRSGT